MVYPAVVLSFATLVLIFMLLFIVPVFVEGVRGPRRRAADADEVRHGHVGPAPRLLVHHLPGADRGSAFGLRKLKRTEKGRQNWDRFKLRIPMKIGDVVQKVALARFSRTLSTLVAAGVDIIQALEITGSTAGNWVIEQSLADVRTRVHEGARISDAADRGPDLPADGRGRWSRSARRPASSTRCSARSRTSTRTRSTRASRR